MAVLIQPGRGARLAALAATYALVAHVIPRPEAVTPAGWRTTAVFLATIVGLMLRPLPGAVVVLMGVALLPLVGGLGMQQALGGFGSPTVWLVVAAMLLSRALRDTGLARRIALLFVRLAGRTSLGLGYALIFTDVVLASSIPSVTARSGGIVLPVARGLAELYESLPGPTANRLGAYLMATLYQGGAVACAMFVTGQASNVLVAGLAAKAAGVSVTWAGWFTAALVPGLVSCAVVPALVHRLLPPTVTRTPAAAEHARRQLAEMGPMRGAERIVLAVVLAVCASWITAGWHRMDITLTALVGVSILIATGVLPWERAIADAAVWDVFVWYGGLVTMGEALGGTGAAGVLAGAVGKLLGGLPWFGVLIAALLIFHYAHYAFASITAHVLSMFVPFVLVLVAAGAPPRLAVFALAFFVNLAAGLTHYGTTTGPIVFAEGYVGFGPWWRTGFLVSLVNLAIWLTVGLGWWKLIGLW